VSVGKDIEKLLFDMYIAKMGAVSDVPLMPSCRVGRVMEGKIG
jgi:hypothetical protein